MDQRANAQPTEGKRWLVPLILLAIHAASLWCLFAWRSRTELLEVPWGSRGVDAAAVRRAGERALHGGSLYAWPDRRRPRAGRTFLLPFRYPPAAAFSLGAFLSVFPEAVVPRTWLALSELILMSNALVLARFARSPSQSLLGLSPWLLSPAVFADLWLGQFSLVTAILVFWSFLAWGFSVPSSYRKACRGLKLGTVLWTLAVLVKGMPLMYAVFLLQERRTARYLWWGVGLAFGTSLLYFSLRPEELPAFVRLNADPAATWGSYTNIGAWHLIERVAVHHQSVAVRRAVGGALAAIVGIACLTVTARAGTRSTLWLLGLWTCAFLLVFREVWIHHYCFLIPFVSLLALTREPDAGGASGRWYSTAAIVLSVWALLPNPFPGGSAVLLGAISPAQLWRPLPTILLFGVCFAAVQNERLQSRGEDGGQSTESAPEQPPPHSGADFNIESPNLSPRAG